jgi:hypothetical protein
LFGRIKNRVQRINKIKIIILGVEEKKFILKTEEKEEEKEKQN